MRVASTLDAAAAATLCCGDEVPALRAPGKKEGEKQ